MTAAQLRKQLEVNASRITDTPEEVIRIRRMAARLACAAKGPKL